MYNREDILGESVCGAGWKVRVLDPSAPSIAIRLPQSLARLDTYWSRMDFLNLGEGLHVKIMNIGRPGTI